MVDDTVMQRETPPRQAVSPGISGANSTVLTDVDHGNESDVIAHGVLNRCGSTGISGPLYKICTRGLREPVPSRLAQPEGNTVQRSQAVWLAAGVN